MERWFVSPVARLSAPCCLLSLLLMSLATQPSTCNREHGQDEEQVEALSVTAQVTPTPPWVVVWDPTQPVEDETNYLLSSQESDPLHRHGGQQGVTASLDGLNRDPSAQPREEVTVGAGGDGGRTEDGETEPEEVDPQFYVTVTISSLLIFTAVVITAKLCYDRSCSQHPAPLSRGGAPPLSLALPRSLASEDSRQTLRSASSSFPDRERIPVVNL